MSNILVNTNVGLRFEFPKILLFSPCFHKLKGSLFENCSFNVSFSAMMVRIILQAGEAVIDLA